jgi:hypothetical protein
LPGAEVADSNSPPLDSAAADLLGEKEAKLNQETAPGPIECRSVAFVDLNQGMCKWLLGDDCYCGNPTPWRAPYCAGHAGIAYKTAAVRNRLDRQLLRLQERAQAAPWPVVTSPWRAV